MRKFAVFCCLVLISLSLGCSRKSKDQAIADDIRAKAAAYDQLQAAQVAVESKQGKVKLTGKVNSPAAQQELEKIAKQEPNVSEVDDETTVAAPPKPAKPVPSFSAAQKVGVFAYAKNNQSHDQQLIDEYDCYTMAQQQSGVNPETPAPKAPTQAEIQAAQQQAASDAQQVRGGRARGAARGAAGGAMMGAIGGDAGKGAGMGAVGGAMVGGARQRRTNAQLKQAAATDASSQLQQDYQQEKAAYDKQMSTYKRAFSGCLDARGYSVR